MMEAEERKMNERKQEAHERALRDEKEGKIHKHHKKQEHHEKQNKEEPDKGKSSRG